MALDVLRDTWEKLGGVDPLWAVLTDPGRRDGRWDVEEFMKTGPEAVGQVRTLLGERSLGSRVLDFGCGVGRLSNALAAHADRVVGVDIASTMVARARELNRHPDRVEFVHYDGRLLPFEDASFDGALSLIVLQHARPWVQIGALLELLRVVKTGGTLVVQIPSARRAPVPMPEEAYRADIEVLDAPSALGVGQSALVRARVTNLSAHPWPGTKTIKLGNHWRSGGEVVQLDDGRAGLPALVAPGESFEVGVPVTAPRAGELVLELDLVHEMVTWWETEGGTPARVPITVTASPAPPSEVTPAGEAHPGEQIEMHALHTEFVQALFGHCGAEVIAAVPDEAAGEEWESFTYVVSR